MRTTIQLDDNLHEMARRYAQANGKTLTALLEELLREKLLARPKRLPAEQVKLKTVNGRGMLRGVDLDDNAALLDLMETR
ncbi:MAG: CopG family transcriptional regulator [Hydrogenophilales bacterium CG17_big_fil_post_rev_8_21_14_2_50_63_12]|nr:MAG: CopG family transcriptional regulator [Hydrogenophilales bacterium CG17_big_fil_post_rev_8_21_14_2_50_63_12]PIX96027.1 MAG: CopG family transcriptional regulator [Hydrogenophilales bacterium CG_4_10_14_3_um_filter_63_21]